MMKKEKIIGSLTKAIEETGLKIKKVWGEAIEDRGSQITFSALGQQAPLEEKKNGTLISPNGRRSKQSLILLFLGFLCAWVARHPLMSPKPGIDKAYGIRKLRDTLGIAIQEMIFIGDALFPGGNDYPAEEAGVVSIRVKNPTESKRVIETIIACLDTIQHAKLNQEENQ